MNKSYYVCANNNKILIKYNQTSFKCLVQEHFILNFAQKCSQTNNAGLRIKCS